MEQQPLITVVIFFNFIVLEFESAGTQQEKKCTDSRLFYATLFLFELPFAAIPIP